MNRLVSAVKVTAVLAFLLIFLVMANRTSFAVKDDGLDIMRTDKLNVGLWMNLQELGATQQWARLVKTYYLLGYQQGFDSGLAAGRDELGEVLSKCYQERRFSPNEISALLDKYHAGGAPAFAKDVKLEIALLLTIMKACNLTNNNNDAFLER